VSGSASCRLARASLRGLSICLVLLTFIVVSIGPAAAESMLVEVAKAQAFQDKKTKEAVLSVTLNEASKKQFNEFTDKNNGRSIVLRFEGRVLLTAIIRDPIVSGILHISGNLSIEEAKEISKRLSAGSKLEVDIVQ
jgi:preprotein translocase subunit SecD